METAATRALTAVVSGMVGLAVGSFLNVVVYRLPRGESINRPPSHCPSCQTPLGPWENVPVASWLVLRGRCAHCQAPISVRYPLIELLTGALFAAVAVALPSVAPVAPLALVMAASVAIGAIDLDCKPVPSVLGWVGLVASASLAAVAVAARTDGRLVWAGIGVGAALLGWLLDRFLASRSTADPFPALVTCVAWGWAAGWIALGGGVAVGSVLAVLAVLRGAVKLEVRCVTAVASAVAVLTILAGAIAAR